jgi:hypothetical protein
VHNKAASMNMLLVPEGACDLPGFFAGSSSCRAYGLEGGRVCTVFELFGASLDALCSCCKLLLLLQGAC